MFRGKSGDLTLHQYGLGPIMKDLGRKLEAELKPGSIVVSNVFTVPGWKIDSSTENVHLYTMPSR